MNRDIDLDGKHRWDPNTTANHKHEGLGCVWLLIVKFMIGGPLCVVLGMFWIHAYYDGTPGYASQDYLRAGIAVMAAGHIVSFMGWVPALLIFFVKRMPKPKDSVPFLLDSSPSEKERILKSDDSLKSIK